MQDKPRRTHVSSPETQSPARYRATWRGIAVMTALALATPVAVWAISRPVQALTLAVVAAVAHALARALHRTDGVRLTAGRRVAARALGRVTRD
jgi:hypothetical protein